MKGIQPLPQVVLLITMPACSDPAAYREFEDLKEVTVALISPFWSWEMK